jgi:hypothetical protein
MICEIIWGGGMLVPGFVHLMHMHVHVHMYTHKILTILSAKS